MKKLALIVIIPICIGFISYTIVTHSLFIHEITKKISLSDFGTFDINPVTNTIVVTTFPAEYRNNLLGMFMMINLVPTMERKFSKEFTKSAKEHWDYYAYLVPFSVKIDVN